MPFLDRRRLAHILVAALVPGAAAAQIDEVIVTAQLREESAQDVPISITAFDTDALKMRQIGTFGDFRYTVPNVSFAKGNFTGSNFSIRGIGNSVIAAGSDSGVEVAVNEVPVLFPRLFETEFFDVQQVAVLRGPQGTLFGRNSTGGAISMITTVADTGGRGGYLEAQYGNYAHGQVEGALNLPVNETLAVRFAGMTLQRDGYTENVAPGGDDVDDRSQYSLRGSLRWAPGENTTLDLMASWFEEDSSRTRSQKIMCNNDPSAVLGCLPDRLEFEYMNPLAQLTGILPNRLGPFGPTPALANNTRESPHDLRKVELDFQPVYEADETLLTVRAQHELARHTLTAVAGYQDTSVYSLVDFTNSLGPTAAASPLVRQLFPRTWEAFFADGCLPISAPSDTGTGIVGGHVGGCSTTLDGYDQANQETDQASAELRVQSNYDGTFNFMAGAFYIEAETSNEYWVLANGLDYFAVVYPAVADLLNLPGTPPEVGDGYGMLAPSYINRTRAYELESGALFGEAYLQLRDDLQLTLGARYTIDRKRIDHVQHLFNEYRPDPDSAGESFVFVPFGYDGAIPHAPGRQDDVEWKETTGRVVLDWSPELASTDATLVYASWSRGYKGGGFNPPFDRALFPNTAESFDPEFVDAWELGTKNTLFGHRLQANLAAFFYDYQGLQVSRIVNRTAFNENTDARIHGVESELLFAPGARWQFNANIAWLKTEIRDFASVDTRDPSAGRDGIDVTLIKDNSNASNCVIHHNGAAAPALPANGPADDRIQSCESLAATLPAPYTVDEGVPVNLGGNRLIHSPEWTAGLGAQFGLPLAGGLSLLARVDYYWQDEMYGRVFNRPIDRIGAWDVWNAQATLASGDGSWFLRAFVRNIEDEDNVVGMHVSDPSSGLFTNLFLIEPRSYGIALGYTFD